MAVTAMGGYDARIARFGLASLEEVAAAAAEPTAVFLDVRSPAEVEAEALSKPFVHIPVQGSPPNDFSAFAAAEASLPDKTAPIICFCGVGGRVVGAKAALEEQGCAF